MSTGYTKQSTYQNGNVISAELFNSDFNLLQSAFAYSSTDASAAGHTHDGTTGGGGAISKIGDLDFQNKIQIDGSNNKIQFFVEINTTPVEVLNVTATALEPIASGYDLGTSTNPFDTVHINSLTVDTNTLHVDSVNNRVGIGNVAPATALDVTGTVTASGLTVDTNTLYVNAASDRVGIGTTNPTHTLDVAGQIQADDAIHIQGTDYARLEVGGGTGAYLDLKTPNSDDYDFRIIHDDAGSKFISPNADVKFDVGGSLRTIIKADGSVGIGTNDPQSKLHVRGTGTTAIQVTGGSSNVAGIYLGDADGLANGRLSYSNADNSLQLFTSGSEAMRIDNTGNVGIGTVNPSYPLHVKGDDASILIQDSTTGFSDQASGVILTCSGADGTPRTDVQRKVRLNGDALTFTRGPSDTEHMRIDASGNVGIGTASPNDKFHVANGSTGAGYLRIANNEGYARLGTDGGNLLLDVGGSEKARIDASGNVGIGTDSPQSKMHINSTTFDEALLIESTDQFTDIHLKDNGGSSYIRNSNGSLILEADRANASGSTATVFKTDNTERVRIDASGNVGIGTDSPTTNYTKTLHIHGSGTGASLHLTDPTSGATASDGLEVFQYGNDGYIWEREAGHLRFGTSALERMRIDSSGNVGIGTNNPAGNLHVSSGTSGDATLILEADTDDSNEADNPKLQLRQDSNLVNGEMYLEGNSGNTASDSLANSLVLEARDSNGNNNIQFVTGGNISTPTNGTVRMTIKSNGNVGIGTSNPSSPLTVATSASGWTTHLYNNATSGSKSGLLLDAGSTVSDYAMYVRNATTNADFFTIRGDGNVGIGTSSPTHTLHVDGSVRIGNASTINENIYLSYFDETSHATLGDIFENSSRSAFGGLIESGNSGQLVVGIRNNDNSDGFSVVTGGPNPEWDDDNVYDHEVFSVRSNKVVGINASTIGATLHVHQQDTTGTNKPVFRASSHGGGGFQIVCSDVAVANPVWNLNTFYGEELAFGDGTTEHVRIDASGNVGIGTDEPDEALTVAGNVQVEADNAFIQFKDTDAIADRKIRRIYNSEQNLHFSSRNDDGTLIDNHLTIAHNGNIGIGTTNPQKLLDIQDSVNGRVDVQITNNFDDDDETAPNPSSRIYLSATSNNGYLEVHGAPEDSGNLHRVELGSTAASSFISFAPNGSEKARINAYGLFVGNTSSDLSDVSTTAGARITQDTTYLSSDSENTNTPLIRLNRLSGEGSYIEFRQGTGARAELLSDTNVFELKAFTDTLKLTASAAASINFTTTAFSPDSANDATISLGGSSTRFDDLHLSGTSYSTGAEITGGDLVLYSDDTAADTQSIRFENSGTDRTAYIRADYDASENGNDTSLIFGTNDGSADGVDRLRINKNGDISFYEDDGTTAGVFWNASEKKLGIGETTPLTALHVGSNATQGNVATFGSASQTQYTKVNFDAEGTAGEKYIISYGDSHSTEAGNLSIKNTDESGDLFFVGGNVEGIRINSSGNVGVKNNNPTEALDVTGNIKASGTVATGGFTLPSTDGTDGQALITDGSGNVTWGSVAAESGSVSGDFGSTALETDDYIRAGVETLTYGTEGLSYQIKASSASSGSPTTIQITNERDYVASNSAFNKIDFVGKYLAGNDTILGRVSIQHLERVSGVPELRLQAGGSSTLLSLTNNGAVLGGVSVDPAGSGDPKFAIISTKADIRLEASGTGVTTAPTIDFVATNQDQTNLGATTFNGKNASDAEVEFASIKAVRTDDTSGDEKSKLTIKSHAISLEGIDLNISSALSYEEEDVTTKLLTIKASAIYNTINDYDGGRWRRSRGASWYNETFNDSTRGSRKEFPEKALIAVSSSYLHIYDATKKDNPLWATYSLNAFTPLGVTVDDSTSLQVENGKVLVQVRRNVAGTNIHAILFDFAEDIVTVYQGSEAITGNSGSILSTQSSFVQESSKDLNNSSLTTFVTKSACMFIDPHYLEINERTGLPKACIALAGENATDYANIFLIQNENGRVKNLYHITQYTRMRHVVPIPELNTIGAVLETYSQSSPTITGSKAIIIPISELDFKSATGSATGNLIHTLGTLGTTGGENFHTTSGAQAFGTNEEVTDVTEGFKAFTFTDNSLGFIRTLNKSQEASGPDRTKLLTCRITHVNHTGWMFPKTRFALVSRFQESIGTQTAGNETVVPYSSTSTQLEIPTFTRSNTVAVGPVASGAELGYYTAPSGSSGVELRSSGTVVDEAFELSESDDEGFGMSFWIRRTASHSTHTILNWGVATGNELKIDMSSTGEIQVYHKTGTTYGSPLLESDATNLNEWINVRVTRNTQSHLMKLYVNGILKDTVDYSTTIGGAAVGNVGKFNLQDFYQVSLFKLSHTYEGHSNALVYEVYKDESQLFKSGAKWSLNSTSSNFVAYNMNTNILHVANNNEYSQYDGLVKIYEDTTSALSDISYTISSADNLTMGD